MRSKRFQLKNSDLENSKQDIGSKLQIKSIGYQNFKVMFKASKILRKKFRSYKFKHKFCSSDSPTKLVPGPAGPPQHPVAHALQAHQYRLRAPKNYPRRCFGISGGGGQLLPALMGSFLHFSDNFRVSTKNRFLRHFKRKWFVLYLF